VIKLRLARSEEIKAVLSLHGGTTRHTDDGTEDWVSFKVEHGSVPVTPDTVGKIYGLVIVAAVADVALMDAELRA